MVPMKCTSNDETRIICPMQRRHQAIPLEQAAREAPVLGTLMEQAQLSRACGACIARLVPELLRPHISYGLVDAGEWCVLVKGHAVAAKARQLLPLWVAQLKREGFAVERIRLRLQEH